MFHLQNYKTMKANVQISAVKKEFKNGQQGWQVFVEGMEGKLRCEMNFRDALKAIRYSFLLSKKLNLQINEIQLAALSLEYQRAKEVAMAQVAEAATEVAQEACDSASGIEACSDARAQAGSNEVQVAAEADKEEPSDEKSEGAPEEVALSDSPIFKQFASLKEKHPDALLLFRSEDVYKCFEEDAFKAAEVLCLTNIVEEDKITIASFPHYSLDTYLPRLIRHGIRVAICDDITDFCKPAKHNENANAVQQELFTEA